ISPHRITTSAELPRKVTRSTTPVPVFVPLFDGLLRSKKSTYSGRKNNDAGNPSRHSTLRRATKTPSGDSTSISSQACIPLLLTCTGTKLDVPKKISGDPMRRTEVQLRWSADFEQRALMHKTYLVRQRQRFFLVVGYIDGCYVERLVERLELEAHLFP